jgi:AAA+ ATPase superfamily predicted ATPase
MDKMPFIGRDRELELLQRLWQSRKAELLILYGRRRVGKTRLLTRWLEIDRPRALFWVGESTSAYDQLRSFSQSIYNFANPVLPAPDNFTCASWAQAFQQVVRLAQDERLAVIIDEFTSLLAVESGIAGLLQNTWDHVFRETNLYLAISGLHIGMMERNLLSYQAPLYGRATALLKLLPLPFANTRQFFPKYRADERVVVYAMMGGIPAYWERFDPALSIDRNIRAQFLETNNLLRDEPRLLQDFISEAHNYVAILRAIAYGNRTPKEIADFTGLADKHVPAYLARLVDTRFIERRTRVTLPSVTRSGRHYITDPFLRFYCRFLSRRQSQLALGVQDQALEEIKRHLVDFIGAHTWEELCQEWVLRAGAREKLPFLPDRIGSAWTKKAQVDVVGINSMEKTLLLGECKWSPQVMGCSELRELVAKTAEIIPSQGKWTVYYLGFARSGWTVEAQKYADELAEEGLEVKDWQVAGMRLLDLKQVDQDLADWTG